MARTRSGQDLINDAYRRADLEGATDRHPRVDVLRYVNQGCAELYDLLVEARGRQYYRKSPPQSIATLGSTTRYALSSDFYRLISMRVAGPGGTRLVPFTPEDEPWLREPAVTVAKPTHYEIQPGYVECLPAHAGGYTIVVDYVPVFTDLADSSGSLFDGINGWEDYAVNYAAFCMAIKDENNELKQALTDENARLKVRIDKLAPKRDAFRAERVKDVRGDAPFGVFGRRRF